MSPKRCEKSDDCSRERVQFRQTGCVNFQRAVRQDLSGKRKIVPKSRKRVRSNFFVSTNSFCFRQKTPTIILWRRPEKTVSLHIHRMCVTTFAKDLRGKARLRLEFLDLSIQLAPHSLDVQPTAKAKRSKDRYDFGSNAAT